MYHIFELLKYGAEDCAIVVHGAALLKISTVGSILGRAITASTEEIRVKYPLRFSYPQNVRTSTAPASFTHKT